jgi:hypothetical protein
MSGNVCEWCWDRYGTYSSEAQTDPVGASSGSSRVARGGSWCDSFQFGRSSYRGYGTPTDWYDALGIPQKGKEFHAKAQRHKVLTMIALNVIFLEPIRFFV